MYVCMLSVSVCGSGCSFVAAWLHTSVADQSNSSMQDDRQKNKAEPRPAPGEQAPPRDSKGVDLARAEWKPGWKRGGRQAVLAAGTAPPRQDWRTLPSKCPPEPARWVPRILPPRVRTPGALERRVLPSEVPRLSLPGNLARKGDNASYPNRRVTSEDTEASLPTPKAGLGQKIQHLPWSDPEPRPGY